MNTIRCRRKRGRKRSVNFRALWWLVTREATYQVWITAFPRTSAMRPKHQWARYTTDHCKRLAGRLLEVYPQTRRL